MRIRGFALFATVLAAACPTAAEEPTHMLRVTPGQHILAVNTFEMSYPKVVTVEWIIFACCALERPCQADVSSELTPGVKRNCGYESRSDAE